MEVVFFLLPKRHPKAVPWPSRQCFFWGHGKDCEYPSILPGLYRRDFTLPEKNGAYLRILCVCLCLATQAQRELGGGETPPVSCSCKGHRLPASTAIPRSRDIKCCFAFVYGLKAWRRKTLIPLMLGASLGLYNEIVRRSWANLWPCFQAANGWRMIWSADRPAFLIQGSQCNSWAISQVPSRSQFCCRNCG